MDYNFWLIILVVYVIVCWFISNNFDDREIGRFKVFLYSLFVTPVIGVLIGMSSPLKVVKSPIVNDLTSKHQNKQLESKKDHILKRLEEIKRLESVELGSDELTKEKERLKEQFSSLNELSKTEKPNGGDLTPDEWVQKMVSYLKTRPTITPNHRTRILNSMEPVPTDETELIFEVKDDGVLYTFLLELEKIEDTEYSRLIDYKVSRKVVK
jgi:hypothetical protein